MKKRGFGEGLWNGVGGKPEPGETIREAAVRESQEEVGVTPLELQEVGVFDFYFPSDPEKENWNMQVHAFVSKKWEGEPVETEEMAPKWFSLDNIPYESMWADDIIWLPEVLSGKYVNASFYFDEDGKIEKHEMTTMPVAKS